MSSPAPKPPEKLDPGITSGMLLGEFPLPSYLKVRLSLIAMSCHVMPCNVMYYHVLSVMSCHVLFQSTFLVNSLYEGVRRPGMTLAGMALLGAGGELIIHEMC